MLKRLLITAAIAVASVAGSAMGQAASPDAVAVSPAIAQATANKALMVKGAQVKTRTTPDYPDSEKAAGNGGRVEISGIITVDGRFEEAAVVRSNAGPVLTASALADARATEFVPAKDKAGVPIAVFVSLQSIFQTDAISADTISFVAAKYDDALRAAGVHGKVKVTGTVREDGHLGDLKVVESSRSAELDQAALAAAGATVFRVYRDGAGQFIERSVKVPYSFDSYSSASQGGGILRYTCGQFSADQTWWRANWPSKERGEFYAMIVGMGMVVELKDTQKLKIYLNEFDGRWAEAIESCRKKPDALFIDVFKPEGDYARALADQAW